MYQIVGTRGIGKTKKLLETIQEKGGIVVCKDPIKMREKASFYGCSGLTILSYQEYIESEKTGEAIYIINLQEFVEHYAKNNLKGYTLSLD